MPFSIAMVPSSPPMARMAPTERSMPPETMIMVMPSDMMLITAVCRTTLDRLVPVRKLGEPMASPTNRTIRVRKGKQALDHDVRFPAGRAPRGA